MPNLACRYSADTLLECPTPLVLRPPCFWSVADKLHGMLTRSSLHCMWDVEALWGRGTFAYGT
jgi:hypothetical protein